MKKMLERSRTKELEVISEARSKGHMAFQLSGNGPFNVLTIDHLDRKINLIEVRAKKGSTFRIDRDTRVFPEFLLVTKKVTYDGKVDD